MFRMTLSIAVAAALSVPTGVANAQQFAYVAQSSHGPANCQSALPVFDGNIRKRPKALANEGTAVAFVTCDFDDIVPASRELASSQVSIRFSNYSDRRVFVSCSFVNGFDGGSNTTLVRSAFLNPEALRVPLSISTSDEDIDYEFIDAPAISCAIPPGVSIVSVTRNVLRYLPEFVPRE